MRILVTGGTGFVGSHSVKAFLDAGHEVRLLVRRADRIAPALEPLGIMQAPEHAVGDVTDERSVRAALDGCDAVLHAANIYALGRQSDEMMRVNPASTEIVLGAAHELGLDPIIHVSSIVALVPKSGSPVLSEQSPPGWPAGPYGRSKVLAERIARRLQEQGAPVVTIYPGGVWGPHDPYLGESSKIALDIAKHRLPVVPDGHMTVCDVRDVAAVHAAVMKPGNGPQRHMVIDRDVSLSEIFSTVRRATGRRIPALPIPGLLTRPVVTRLGSVPSPAEGLWFLQHGYSVKDGDTRDLEAQTGVRTRPAVTSIEDTLRWLAEAGHLSPRYAGALG